VCTTYIGRQGGMYRVYTSLYTSGCVYLRVNPPYIPQGVYLRVNSLFHTRVYLRVNSLPYPGIPQGVTGV